MIAKRLALGTVQFGLKYGISNISGIPSKESVFETLRVAYKEGIDTLDTAYSYGKSEELIGDFITETGTRFNIISKMPDIKTGELDEYFRKTLERTNQDSIYGYLVHKFENITRQEGLWRNLEVLKHKGLVEKIGVSIYKVEELECLLDHKIPFDIIQFPYNIFDQRFCGYFQILKKRNVEIHTRSVFLQGLFFLKIKDIKERFPLIENKIDKLYSISLDYKIPIYALCFCFVLSEPLIDKIVIGVYDAEQLKEAMGCEQYLSPAERLYDLLKDLKTDDESLILPYNWKV